MTRWEQGIAFTVLACASAGAHAGAYLRSEGELLHDLRAEYAVADQAWDADGATQDTGCAQHHSSLMAAIDYGFSYYLTGFAKAGVAHTTCDPVATAGPPVPGTAPASETGPSDLTLGIRGRLNMFANNRSWELEGYVPSRALGGHADLGCDAYGGAVRLEARDEIVPRAFIGYGAGYRYWDKPLVPQAIAMISYSAPMNRHARHPRWEWGAGLNGTWALEDGDTVQQGPSTQLDCSSRARVVRAALDFRYQVGMGSRVGCGVSSPVWGRDVRVAYGLSCVYSVLWE